MHHSLKIFVASAALSMVKCTNSGAGVNELHGWYMETSPGHAYGLVGLDDWTILHFGARDYMVHFHIYLVATVLVMIPIAMAGGAYFFARHSSGGEVGKSSKSEEN